MIKTFKYIFLLFLPVLLSAGCKKYLDLKPEDSYMDEQVFSNPATVRQALNGIYTKMAADELYGAHFTMEALELIGQRYNTLNIYAWWRDMANRYRAAAAPGTAFDIIWAQAYGLVLKTNNFITQLEKIQGKGIVTAPQYTQLMGEAIAIRAFIQFDLLRLYGPFYTGDDNAIAIPYYTNADAELQPLLSMGAVMEKVLTDLNNAEQLLANDPIKTTGVNTEAAVDFYSGLRNRRMNYYAVKALQARVYLYFKNKEQANAAAKAVIQETESIFPWTDFSAIIGNANPDRIFSSEVIMGLYNANLYETHNRLFNAALFPAQMLVPTNAKLTAAFEGNENDYRYTSTWLPSSHGFRTFYKFADLTDVTKDWRFFQPLIRKSEMYYILAETETDPALAVQYLNTVRFNRGLPDLATDVQITGNGELEKEYIKEFYGEGQLYFFYKRIMPSWLSPPIGRVPIPIAENELR